MRERRRTIVPVEDSGETTPELARLTRPAVRMSARAKVFSASSRSAQRRSSSANAAWRFGASRSRLRHRSNASSVSRSCARMPPKASLAPSTVALKAARAWAARPLSAASLRAVR